MTPSKKLTDMIQLTLNRYPFNSIVVPCPCLAGHPYPAKKDCEYCNGTGKIMYGLSEVEVV